jgi:putative salt-induced outer membrane protein
MKKGRDRDRLIGWEVVLAVLMIMAGSGQVWAQAPAAAAPAPAAGVPAPEKKSAWERSAALGLTVTSGNSDTILATANVLAATKWNRNELSMGAGLTYGESDDVKNNESARGFAQYNRLFSERAFGYLRVEAMHDEIADVEYRLMVSPGAGYYFIKNVRTFLRGEVGPGFIWEQQGDDKTAYFTLRIAERFEHKFSDRAKLWESLEFLPQVDDFQNFLLNGEIGVETAVTKVVSLQVYLQDTYDNEPAPGRKENDLKLVAAVAVKF